MLLRQFGQKRAMLFGLSCAILTTTALFWVRSIPEAILYRLMAGFGIALYNVARHAYMADKASLANRGRAIAIFGGVNRIGKFLGPAIGGAVGLAYGLRAPFLLFGAVAIIALIVVALFMRSTEQTASPSFSIFKPDMQHLISTVRMNYQILITAGGAQLFAQTVRAGRDIIIPLYGADIIGLDVGSIGLIVSIAGGVDMALFYPAGLLMDRRGRKFAIVPCFLTQAIGMALIPFTGSFAALLTVTSIIGFGNGLGSGTMMTLGADLAPTDSRGEFLGVWRLIGDIGSSGAPLVVGWVATFLILQTAIWTVALSGLISVLIFAFLVPETLRKPPPISGLTTPSRFKVNPETPGGEA